MIMSQCKKIFRWTLLGTALLVVTGIAVASPRTSQQSVPHADPRGEAELVLCSQNLENLGVYNDSKARMSKITPEEYEKKIAALVERFLSAKCDVVAVQEVIGASDKKAKGVLAGLAAKLSSRAGRIYEARVGPTNDKILHNGLITATDRVTVLSTLSYRKVELPKISKSQRPRFFSRGPFEVQLRINGRGDSPSRNATIIVLHFKSQGGREADPAGLHWETYRMEMAEALRRIVESRHARAFAGPESLLMVVGDRNSSLDRATAQILHGVLNIEDFNSRNAPCRLSKNGVPLCQGGAFKPQRLFSLITPETLPTGTFHYKKNTEWLDDILVPSETLRYAWENYVEDGRLSVGGRNAPANASDHTLVKATFNW